MVKVGFVLYNQEDLIVNQSFAQWLSEEAKTLGIELLILTRESLSIQFGQSLQYYNNGQILQQPCFIINRSRDYHLSLMLETYGVRLFNNAAIAQLGNRKELAYAYAQNCGIPVLPFYLNHQKTAFSYDVPHIIKTPEGHGGNQVFLKKEYNPSLLNSGSLASVKEDWIITQSFCEGLKGDLRVYILNNQIYASVIRYTPAGTYLSNYTKGAEIDHYDIIKTPVEGYIETLLKGVYVDYCGIDFLVDYQGNYYFNEIEDAVGSRMLTHLAPELNVAKDLMRHISLQMSR